MSNQNFINEPKISKVLECIQNKKEEINTILLNKNQNVYFFEKELNFLELCTQNDEESLKTFFLENQSQINQIRINKIPLLHLMCAYQFYYPLLLLFENIPKNLIDINILDNNQNNILHVLASVTQKNKYFFNILQYLKNYDLNINAKNNQGETPLFIAIKEKNKPMVLFLINYPTINFYETNILKQNILHYICKYSNDSYIHIINSILDKNHKEMLYEQDEFGCIPLHYACINKNKTIIDILTKNDKNMMYIPNNLNVNSAQYYHGYETYYLNHISSIVLK